MPHLAENTRTAIMAAIKRGSAQARAAMRRLDKALQDQVEAAYREAARDIERIIDAYAGSDGSVRLEVMQDLLGQVNQRLNQLSADRGQMLDAALSQSAQMGVEPYAGTGQFITRAADDALNFVVHAVQADGLQLSDRIWRLDNGAREALSREIQSAVIQGKSASQAASDFLARGQDVPADVLQKMGSNQASRITRATSDQLLRADGNPRDAALRVFRTEMNRAHGEAYMLAGEDHPDFGGWRFLLSPRHPRTDICDMHASVNRYGLGKGVYPSRERCPWPAHPNTLSFVEIVFKDEIDPEDKKDKQDRISWLNDQSPGVQRAVLKSRYKQAVLNRGLLKEGQIATPERILKGYFMRKGVDISPNGAYYNNKGIGSVAHATKRGAIMKYKGSEKQVKWANDILPADELKPLLIALREKINGLPTVATRRRPYISATQKEFFTRKINIILEMETIDASNIIDLRGVLTTMREEGLKKLIGSIDTDEIGVATWVWEILDADLEKAMKK